MGRLQSFNIDATKSYGLALVICDRIVVEGGGESRTIVGTSDVVYGSSFPVSLPRLSIYASVHRASADENRFYLGIFRSDGRLIASGVVEGPWNSAGVVEFHIVLSQVIFPEEGDYLVRLFDERQPGVHRILLERKIVARRPPESPAGEPGLPTP